MDHALHAGPQARAEYRAFTKRSLPTVVEVDADGATPLFSTLAADGGRDGDGIEAELLRRGITRAAAADLARDHDEAKIREHIDRLDWLISEKPAKVEDPAAYLVGAIKNDYAAPRATPPCRA